MEKKEYVAPEMTVMVVELEKGFMSASVIDDQNKGGKIKSVGQDYESFDFAGTDSGNITWEE